LRCASILRRLFPECCNKKPVFLVIFGILGCVAPGKRVRGVSLSAAVMDGDDYGCEVVSVDTMGCKDWQRHNFP
jgi:hypothetical protein